MRPTILLSGATGTVGRAALVALRAAGADVRAFVRDAERARELLGPEVPLLAGDLGDPGSLRAALEGVEAMLLCSAHGPHMREVQLAAARVLRDSQVSRVVKISGSAVTLEHPQLSHSGADHLAVEEALRAGRADAVAVRPNVFMQNFLDQSVALAHGALPGPAGDPRVSFVDARDAGRVAAAALLGADTGAGVLEVTGPAALTWFDVAAVLSEVMGREVLHYPAAADVARAGLLAMGRPEWLVDHQLEIAALLGDPRAALVTDTVERLTGTLATGLADFLRENAASLPAPA